MLVRLVKCTLLILFLYLAFVAIIQYIPRSIPKNEWRKAPMPYPSDTMNNLFWFVQISDIHISKYYDLKRGPDLREFCSKNLEIIKPEVVLVTGDLTDAKHKNLFGSKQYFDEWAKYNDILKDTKVIEKYVWLDMRGNHDAFNVISSNHPNNMYAKFSGSKGKLTNTTWNLVKPFGTYSFVPVDASLVPGPKRPFNFAGHLTVKAINRLQVEGEKNVKNNMTIWYGHYPTTSISTEAKIGLSSIVGYFGSVYLCGHLHDLGGLFPRLQAMHQSGFLELELADWKWNRKYRILAVDHDMLSYADADFGEWPIVIVTNPKRAREMMPLHEPISRISKSTHIRFLAFSPADIRKATVFIDGAEVKESVAHIDGPLWACRWDPTLYSSGTHQLRVKVEDAAGNVKIVSSDFSLDEQWSVDFDLAATLILLTDFCSLVKFSFSIFAAIAVATLLFMKYVGVSIPHRKNFLQLWLFRLQLLSSDNVTFYVILAFLLNLLLGPLFVGEIVTDHIGVCFTYGLLVDGHLIKDNMIYVHAMWMILFTYLPVVAYLSYAAELRWLKNLYMTESFRSLGKPVLGNLVLGGVLYLLVSECRALYLSYGGLALLLSPATLWWLLAVCGLTFRLWTVNNPKLQRR